MATQMTRWGDHETHPNDLDDLRSWTVCAGRNREEVGDVEEILLDEHGVPRYLEVDLDSPDRTVLVPAGYARMEPGEEVLWIPAIEGGRLADIPAWGSSETLNPEYERQLASAYDSAHAKDDFYTSPHFDNRGFPSTNPRLVDDEFATNPRVIDEDEHAAGNGETGPSAAAYRVDSLDDIDVADHDPDPRGWTVVDREGESFGTVDHLLGDTAQMKVRYLVVKLDLDDDDDRRNILVPAGHVDLDVDDEEVRIAALDRHTIGQYPRWVGHSVDRNHEQQVTGYLESSYDSDATRYSHPRYNADSLRRG